MPGRIALSRRLCRLLRSMPLLPLSSIYLNGNADVQLKVAPLSRVPQLSSPLSNLSLGG